MTNLFRNSSPGALTLKQSIEQEKKRLAERRRQMRKARELAAQGRSGDTEVAHVALGELVLPRELQSPDVLMAIQNAAAPYNVPLEMLSVGHVMNNINPSTGAPEFAFEFMNGIKNWASGLFGSGENAGAGASSVADATGDFTHDFPGVNAQLQGYDFDKVPGANESGISPEMNSFMSRTTDFAQDGKDYAVFGPDDPETLKRARVIFGETSGVYPALRDPQGTVFDENNWVPGSADDLARARAHIGAVSARNSQTRSADPDLSKYFDRYQWNKSLEAARASKDLDRTLPSNVDGFFMRQDGTNQYIPNYDKLFDIGPFYTVGGHKKVDQGNRMYVDFHPKLYHSRKNER